MDRNSPVSSLPSCSHVKPRCLPVILYSLPILSQLSAVHFKLITYSPDYMLSFMRFSYHSVIFVSSRDLYACCQNVNENSVLILTEPPGIAVTPCVCIWEVVSLNHNWDNNFPGRYLWLSWVYPGKCQDSASIRPWLLPFRSIPIRQLFYCSVLYSLDMIAA
jgi:hypothetical protein